MNGFWMAIIIEKGCFTWFKKKHSLYKLLWVDVQLDTTPCIKGLVAYESRRQF